MKQLIVLFTVLLFATQPVLAAFPVLSNGLSIAAVSDTPIVQNRPEGHDVRAMKQPGPAHKGFALLAVVSALIAVAAFVAAIIVWPVTIAGALGLYLLTIVFGLAAMGLAYTDGSSVKPHNFWDITAFCLAVIPLIPLEIAAGAIFLVYDLFRTGGKRRKQKREARQQANK